MRGVGIALPPLARRVVGIAALAAVYFVAAKLGLRFAFVHPSATAVWAPTGIALAAFLISGNRVWPAIFVGAFLANLTTAGSVLTSLGIAAGNTLEGWAGAWLLRRYGGGRGALQTPRGVFTFALLAAALSTTVSATIGVACLTLAGRVDATDLGPVWLTWWLGDASGDLGDLGDLIVAPVILAWHSRHDLQGASGTWQAVLPSLQQLFRRDSNIASDLAQPTLRRLGSSGAPRTRTRAGARRPREAWR